MADHCEAAWDFIRRHVCPEWDHADAKGAFFVGYEDRATELANAGEAGYETLAEAGTVADTEDARSACASTRGYSMANAGRSERRG
ncbi:hypothetical protein BURMUCF1_1166 [Burkholderia multivorans ATCC BAA-247]|nr:hypothetical protein BURMUCF1_1166 [Burkholderia multivorans ATCC BAA-247]